MLKEKGVLLTLLLTHISNSMNIPEKSWVRFTKVRPQIFVPAQSIHIFTNMGYGLINTSDKDIFYYPVTISHFIRFFPLIPDLVLQYSGIKITDKDDLGLIEIINSYKEIYKGMTLWLIRKHEGIIDERIYLSPYKHYEVYAKRQLELLGLIQSLFDKSYYELVNNLLKPCKKSKAFNAGEEGLIWFSSEFFSLKREFEQNGLLGKAIKEGRRSRTDKQIERYSQRIDEYHLTKMGNPSSVEISADNTYQVGAEMIEMFAEIISQTDIDFYHDVYKEYCKNQKRIFREIRNTSVGHCFYLSENGEVIDIKRGKRGKGKK